MRKVRTAEAIECEIVVYWCSLLGLMRNAHRAPSNSNMKRVLLFKSLLPVCPVGDVFYINT